MKKIVIILTMIFGILFTSGCSAFEKIPEGMSKNTYENGVKCLNLMNSYIDGSKAYGTIVVSLEEPYYKILDEYIAEESSVKNGSYPDKVVMSINNFASAAGRYEDDSENNKDGRDKAIGYRDQLKEYLGK